MDRLDQFFRGERFSEPSSSSCGQSFVFTSAWDSVVSMMIGVNLFFGSFLISFTNVIPSMFGIFMSLTIRSTLSLCSLSKPSCPSTASKISNSELLRCRLSIFLKTAESSTMRIRFIFYSPYQTNGIKTSARTQRLTSSDVWSFALWIKNKP